MQNMLEQLENDLLLAGAAYRLIPLTRGLFAIVDADDYERLSRYKWHAGGKGDNCYAQRCENGKTIKMHNEIIDVPAGLICDHKNHNRLDNRKCNLRSCTYSQNAQNRRPRADCTSGYKGVCWDRDRRKWQARIQHNGRLIHIGYYEYEQDAAIAYDDMAIELFGEFACLNCHYRPEIKRWLERSFLFWPFQNDPECLDYAINQQETLVFVP
jgi:hypothetical protein